MRRLHTGVLSALALVLGVSAAQADAQSLRGFRAEGQVGITSFHSEGNHDSKIGWGAAVGVDAFVANSFVLGVEGTYWDARPENHTIDGAGLANHKMFQEWGLALRAGVMATPATLIYGKVGYVRDEQRKEFVPFVGGTTNLGGALTPGYYYDHDHVSGIQWGGGIEQNITDMFYVKAEGRYSNYRTNSSRLTGLIGAGVKFGAAVEAPPPPPPPPATQTCPDGSVILATEVCPVPPPPPPPPPPAPERG